MLIILIFLFILCLVFLTVNNIITRRPKRVWPLFEDPSSVPTKDCKTDRDCLAASQKCFDFRCMDTLSQECDLSTGFWTKTPDDKLKCVCRYPDLVTQSDEGKNCAVNIGCGIYGQIVSLQPFRCKCKNDRLFRVNAKGHCEIKTTIPDSPPPKSCPPGYILSTTQLARQFFHPEYLKQFKGRAKCIRVPCSFNVLGENKPLTHTMIVPDKGSPGNWRCLCDPEYGHFGVHLDVKHYLNNRVGHHNACASIYEDEPDYPSPFIFSFYCYFYLNPLSEPVCFLLFTSLPKDGGPFKGKESVAVFDPWPSGYDQKVLGSVTVMYQRRTCSDFTSLFGTNFDCYDEAQERVLNIRPCTDTPSEKYFYDFAAMANDVYKDFFVCSDPGGKTVVNPFAIDFQQGDRFSHGYQLVKDDVFRLWKLKLAPTPYSTHLVLDEQASTRILGRKWKREPMPNLPMETF